MYATLKEKASDLWWEANNSVIGIPGILIVSALVLLLAFLFSVLLQPTERVEISGRVVGKEYAPSSSSVGVGSGVSSDGKPIVVVTNNSKSEEWTIVISVDGEYRSFDVSPEVYYSVQENADTTIICNRGKWFAYIVSCE